MQLVKLLEFTRLIKKVPQTIAWWNVLPKSELFTAVQSFRRTTTRLPLKLLRMVQLFWRSCLREVGSQKRLLVLTSRIFFALRYYKKEGNYISFVFNYTTTVYLCCFQKRISDLLNLFGSEKRVEYAARSSFVLPEQLSRSSHWESNLPRPGHKKVPRLTGPGGAPFYAPVGAPFYAPVRAPF